MLKAEGKEESAIELLNKKTDVGNETSGLLASIKEGKFLGLEIDSISDLSPDNINLIRMEQIRK